MTKRAILELLKRPELEGIARRFEIAVPRPGRREDLIEATSRSRKVVLSEALHDLTEAAICGYAIGLQGLLRIRAIYAAERAVRRASASDRQALRVQHVRPLMTSFFDWARAERAITPGRNLATKALGYAVNQEAELMRVLDDVNLPLDNTRSERALRKIVVGRKLGCSTAVTCTPRPPPRCSA